MDKPKPFAIPKSLVAEAYKLVKANKGGVGVDRESLEEFDKKLDKHLYKIWNRLSSGSYFPPAVRGVEIPKKQGGTRMLGVPTVSDKIAQMVIKLMFEPSVEPYFLEDSYGYRPNKSALDAIGVTRKRCWEYDWLIEFDIKGLFDNIDHELLMKAVRLVFLGYEFRARGAENGKTKEVFTGFLPAISPKAKQAITAKIRELNVRNKSDLSLQEIAKWINPMSEDGLMICPKSDWLIVLCDR